MGKSQSGDIFDVKGIAPTMCSTTTQKDPIKILIDNIGIPTEGTIAKTVRSSGRSSFDKKHSHDLVCILNEKIAIPVLTPDRTEKRQNGRRFKENGDPMFTLTGQDRHGVMINNQRRIKGWVEREDKIFAYGHDKKRSTIQENVFVKGNGIADALTTNHPTKYVDSNYLIRRLTPIECWRLQGFPDWAFDRAVQVNSNSQLYKQAGNSVTVNVIYEVAIRL
jgi:DNA (cytosine-5)-methyltransferase 1